MPEAVTDQLLDSVPDGVFTVDSEWRITTFNRAAEQITGIRRGAALGQRCCDVFRASICESACAVKQMPATGRPVVNRVVSLLGATGQQLPISVSFAALADDRGCVIGGGESVPTCGVNRQVPQPGSRRRLTLQSRERRLIRDALHHHRGNRAAAARAHGINSSAVFRKIKVLRLERIGRGRPAR